MKLLRPRDAAAMLGISTTSLWRRSKESDFPRAFRVGPNAIAWDERELIDYLEIRRVQRAATTTT